MQSMDSKIEAKEIYESFRLIKAEKFDEAETVLNKGLHEATLAKDMVLQGIFYSTLGLLYKVKKKFRKSWRNYEKAEKLLPDDLSLKIISCRLLVEYFGQYDTVIRKMKKVIELSDDNRPLQHQANNVLGLAYLKKGKKEKVIECLKNSLGNNFLGLKTAENLDFSFVTACISKKVALEVCWDYLKQAEKFANKNREGEHVKLIKKFLEMFPKA